MKKYSKTDLHYLKIMYDLNTKKETWRQYYQELSIEFYKKRGENNTEEPSWMSTTQYGGKWLDTVRGHPEF